MTGLREAYSGKRVLVTGHTGFKGSWLTLWLRQLCADVTGYALPPPTNPALFHDALVAESCHHIERNVLDREALARAVRRVRPDIVFHLAAQSLVRRSYENPLETVETNVLGTANLLEALRLARQPCAVVVVTSDKCYENRESLYGYREDDPMGGHDIYSMSKGATELLVDSYRRSFFPPSQICEHGVPVATARAGNVVGGGDWAPDRIVPDSIRALVQKRSIQVRNPRAVRPWQHVLEPLMGYLLLGAALLGASRGDPARYCGPWNFGTPLEDARSVQDVVQTLIQFWGGGEWEDKQDPFAPHEAHHLHINSEKACTQLGWAPLWDFFETVERTVTWYRAHGENAHPKRMHEITLAQIDSYMFAADTRAGDLARDSIKAAELRSPASQSASTSLGHDRPVA